MAIFLPRGPILNDAEDDVLNVSTLHNTLSCPVVKIDYRCNADHQWPTPIHDVLAGYDWIQENLLPKRAINRVGRSEHIGKIAVCGELIGGQLATALALTECRAGEPGVVAAAINNPIADWVAFDEYQEPSLAPKPQTDPQDFHDNLTVDDVLRQRRIMFRRPDHYFDPFASPILFFRSADAEVPWHLEPDTLPVDDMDELAFSEREEASPREQRDLAFLEFNEVETKKKRKASRRYPSKALNLRLPAFYLTAGKDSMLVAQGSELTNKLRKSFERQWQNHNSPSSATPESEDGDDFNAGNIPVQFRETSDLGLWDGSADGRARMLAAAQWLARSLGR